jgi:hypothetical protein
MRGFINLMNWMQKRLCGARPLSEGENESAPVAQSSVEKRELAASLDAKVMEAYAREAGLDTLPNDLTRMLYLGSLRDCNSGLYLHPQLSHRIGTQEANRVLSACHDEVFRRLLRERMTVYVLQLEQYIRYTRIEKNTLLRTWQSLQAYRTTVPLTALPVHAQHFALNIKIALTILECACPSVHEPPHKASSCG